MTRVFAERVIRELIVDTRSYRYIRRVSNKGNIYIMRLPREYLNRSYTLTELREREI